MSSSSRQYRKCVRFHDHFCVFSDGYFCSTDQDCHVGLFTYASEFVCVCFRRTGKQGEHPNERSLCSTRRRRKYAHTNRYLHAFVYRRRRRVFVRFPRIQRLILRKTPLKHKHIHTHIHTQYITCSHTIFMISAWIFVAINICKYRFAIIIIISARTTASINYGGIINCRVLGQLNFPLVVCLFVWFVFFIYVQVISPSKTSHHPAIFDRVSIVCTR